MSETRSETLIEPDAIRALDSSQFERLDEALRRDPDARLSDGQAQPDLVQALRLLNQLLLDTTNQHGNQSLPKQIGRYEVQRELGRGRFGIVYLARDPELKRLVAIKIPRRDWLHDANDQRRFVQEAEVVARMHHPGIVPVLDVGRHDNQLFIVFDYREGASLDAWLNDRNKESVTPKQCAAIIAQVAAAVDHGHQLGIVHRDLKPSNILIASSCKHDELPVACVLDFGFARCIDSDLQLTRSSILVGTPLYMSPEQCKGDPATIGPGTDIFALGIVLYELLSGIPPFAGENLVQVIGNIQRCQPEPLSKLDSNAAPLASICLKCLQREPADRYATASDLADDLNRFIAGQLRTDQPKLTVKHNRGRSGVWLSFGLVLLAMVNANSWWPSKDATPYSKTYSKSLLPTSSEHEIARQVIDLGGTVDFSGHGRSHEFGDKGMIPSDRTQKLDWIMLPKCEKIDDAWVECLPALKNLTGIDLYQTRITDRSATTIARIASLEQVYLHQTALSDEGAKAIATLPRLQGVNFSWTHISDRTLFTLKDKLSLRKLKVRSTRITNEGLQQVRHLRFLQIVDLGDNAFNDEGFLPLANALLDVQELEIDGTGVSDKSLQAIDHWNLKRLRCSLATPGQPGISQARLDAYQLAHPNCYVQSIAN